MARLTGKSRTTISKRLAEAELQPLHTAGRQKYFDSAEALAAILQHPAEMEYTDDLVLSQERAKLAVEQTRRLQRENDIADDMYAPVKSLANALEGACKIIVSHLDSIPLTLKKRNPNLTGKDIELVKKVVAKCRNAAGNAVIDSAD